MADTSSTPSTPLQWALAYAALGWPVVPCYWPIERNGMTVCSCIHKPDPRNPDRCACGHHRARPTDPCSCGRADCPVRCGGPCRNIGKHPRTAHGLKDATTDPAIIRAWWERWPKANIAIVTGPAAGIFAFDLDRHDDAADGLEHFNVLCAELGVSMPDTPRAFTGGNGVHVIMRHPGAGVRITSRGKASALRPGVEVKGDDGYIIAEPSTHKSGRAYEWEAAAMPIGPDAVAVADCPPALLELIATTPKPKRAPAAGPKASYLEAAFDDAGLILAPADDQGRIPVQCPWEREHTGGSGITSTVLFPPSDERTMGWFHCSHAHCEHRTLDEVLAALPEGAIAAAEDSFPCGLVPSHELAALWAKCRPLTSDAAMVEGLRLAGFDADAVDVRGLAAVLPADAEVPPWAREWRKSGHRMIVPMHDAAGIMRSVLAVRPGADGFPWLAPANTRLRTLALADSAVAVPMLEHAAKPDWIADPLAVVVVAGVRDFLGWGVNRALTSTNAPYAVLGVAAESIELEPAIVARIPSGSRVIVRTPDTAKGTHCAARIKAGLGSRCEVLRGKP